MARELSPARDALGRALRVMRVRREVISAERLSRAAGLGRHTVGGIERGAVDPRVSTLRAVTDALDVPASELLALAEEIERGLAPVNDPGHDDGRAGTRPSSEGHPDGLGEVTPEA